MHVQENETWYLLKSTLEHAYEHSPYYRKKWDSQCITPSQIKKEDFHLVPFTSKQDLRDAYPDQMLAVSWDEVAIVHESSGTTGQPTSSFFTEQDLNEWFSRLSRNGINLNKRDIVLIKTPYSMLSTAHQMHGFARMMNATILPAGNRTSLMTYYRVVRLLSDYRPTVLYCMPIELLLFARKAIRLGKNPSTDFPWIRGCVVNGEMLSASKRIYLEKLWNMRIFEDYGSTETTTLGGMCEHGRMHVWSDRYYFEVETARDAQCQSTGTGELIVTSLYREAMPLIRYRMEDWVTLSSSSCPCGSTLPEIKVWGRKTDRFSCQEKWLFPIEIEERIYRFLIGMGPVFWASVYDDRSLSIKLECLEEEKQKLALLIPLMQDAICEELGVTAQFDVVSEGTIMSLDQDNEEVVINKPRYVQSGLNYQ